jgi:hypothetical protein
MNEHAQHQAHMAGSEVGRAGTKGERVEQRQRYHAPGSLTCW